MCFVNVSTPSGGIMKYRNTLPFSKTSTAAFNNPVLEGPPAIQILCLPIVKHNWTDWSAC